MCPKQFMFGGARGVCLYLNVLWTWVYAERLGLTQIGRKIFTASIAWSSSLSHMLSGKLGGVLYSPATK